MAVDKKNTKRRKVAERAKPKTRARSTKPNDAMARNMISKAVDAILKTVADDPTLKRAYFKKLDFTPTSLKAIDAFIKEVWAGDRPSDQGFDKMVLAFGGYVAEIVQRTHEGFWVKSESHYEFHCTKSGKITGFVVSPWSWVYKRFDEGELLAPKYAMIMKMADNFAQA